MTDLVRVTDLTAPPVVGEFYLVPTVKYEYLGWVRKWPVFPSFHEDDEHFAYPWMHYHIDPRFLTRAQAGHIADSYYSSPEATTQNTPLVRTKDEVEFRRFSRPSVEEAATEIRPHPPIEWARRKCRVSDVVYHHGDKPPMQQLQETFAGQQCPKNKAGWVCPHKAYPLGSHAPDERGIITCPLHGLRVDAASGKIMPRQDPPKARPLLGEALAARYDRLPRDPVTGRPVI